MKKLILSAGTIAVALAVVIGGTTAFFSDTELSSGNTFTSGAIDLTIDNESYVTQAGGPNDGALVFSTSTSWAAKDLDEGTLFFSFDDLKPGDVGEDTISLHIVTNPAYACMDVTLTGTPENGVNEPEALVDNSTGANEGELQDLLEFVFWADDGDNVFEADETESVVKRGSADEIFTEDGKWVLADSQGGIFGGPLEPETTYYVAKAWCFGNMADTPVDQDGVGATGTEGAGDSTNGPLTRGTGFSCSGASVNNASQTDGIVVDVAFDAVQARHQDGRDTGFLCNPPTTGTITVHKAVENGDGGEADAADFEPYQIDGNTITLGTPIPVAPGAHTVTENTDPDFAATFSLDCAPNGVVNVVAGEDYECIITNTYAPQTGNITVDKVVVGGQADDSEFSLFVGAEPVVDEVTEAMAPGTYQVSETGGPANYDVSYSGGCTSTGLVTVVAGQDATCIITNTYNPPAPQEGTLTVNKVRVGGFGLQATTTFQFSVDTVNGGTPVAFEADASNDVSVPVGSYTVTEVADSDFTTTYSAGCSGTMTAGGATCTITNTAVAVSVTGFPESFGTGSTANDIANWDEEGTDSDSTTVAQAADTDEDTIVASADGGRYARINSEEWICRAVSTSGLPANATLSYLWTGDSEGENNDEGVVEYNDGGTCTSGGGWVPLALHALDTTSWNSNSILLPATLQNDGSWVLRFRADSNTFQSDENFRVDGVNVSYTPN